MKRMDMPGWPSMRTREQVSFLEYNTGVFPAILLVARSTGQWRDRKEFGLHDSYLQDLQE